MLGYLEHFTISAKPVKEAVNCVWGQYGKWSTCSKTCGGGTRTRTRAEASLAAHGGTPCVGGKTETETCNSKACEGTITFKSMAKESF